MRRKIPAPLTMMCGLLGCGLSILVASLLPSAAWRAWLGAAFLWGSLPVGALALVMMMRLVPGAWAVELRPFAETLSLLVPISAALAIPILLTVGEVYSWAGEAQATAFRSAWLSPAAFAARTLAWFGLLGGLAWAIVVRGGRGRALSAAGLVMWPILGTFVAVDWLLSLDADFASSGFGLYALCLQILLALVAVTGAALLQGSPSRPGVLGGLVLTLLLLWAYFAFMQYFITWSNNLPAGVRWYRARSGGGWSWALYGVLASRLVPATMLLFPQFRNSRRRLAALCAVVFAGTVLETAWLALPAPGGASAAVLALYAVAVASVGALVLGAYQGLHARRSERRSS